MRSRPPVQEQTTDKRGALPLRMTPPWPFSTSPHCASTEPCGEKQSLGGWKSPAAAAATWVDASLLHLEGVEGYVRGKRLHLESTVHVEPLYLHFAQLFKRTRLNHLELFARSS